MGGRREIDETDGQQMEMGVLRLDPSASSTWSQVAREGMRRIRRTYRFSPICLFRDEEPKLKSG